MSTRDGDALKGLRVLVTRAAHQADETVEKLRALGAEVTALPVIEISAPESWEPFDKAAEMLESYDWIIFASVNAVNAFFDRLSKLNVPTTPNNKFATIGPRTTEALQHHGIKLHTRHQPS